MPITDATKKQIAQHEDYSIKYVLNVEVETQFLPKDAENAIVKNEIKE